MQGKTCPSGCGWESAAPLKPIRIVQTDAGEGCEWVDCSLLSEDILPTRNERSILTLEPAEMER